MNILSIESSFDVCGTSLILDHKHVDTIEIRKPKAHSKLLAVYVNDILQKNEISIEQIDVIAVCIGPGSYTGLRIGISLAKGLALPFKKSIYPIDSFAVARFQIKEKSNFSIAFHSHRNFVYHCNVDSNGIMSKPNMCSLDEIVNTNLYGYNLDLISKDFNYFEIKPCSKILAEYTLQNINSKLAPIDKISPIYLSI